VKFLGREYTKLFLPAVFELLFLYLMKHVSVTVMEDIETRKIFRVAP
jgi:hypothetical protein